MRTLMCLSHQNDCNSYSTWPNRSEHFSIRSLTWNYGEEIETFDVFLIVIVGGSQMSPLETTNHFRVSYGKYKFLNLKRVTRCDFISASVHMSQKFNCMLKELMQKKSFPKD